MEIRSNGGERGGEGGREEGREGGREGGRDNPLLFHLLCYFLL